MKILRRIAWKIIFLTSFIYTSSSSADICDRSATIKDTILDILDISDCSLVTIDTLKQIKKIDITSQPENYAQMRESDFKNLDGLIELSLVGTSISNIPPNAFNDLKNLQILYLGGLAWRKSPLRNPPVEIFKNLKSLTHLQINYSEIDTLPKLENGELPELKHLILHYNKFTKIPSLFIKNLSKLDTLELLGNKIKKVSKTDFSNASLESLITLNLAENGILKIIEDGAFGPLKSLKDLRLNHMKSLKKISKSRAGLQSFASIFKFNGEPLEILP